MPQRIFYSLILSACLASGCQRAKTMPARPLSGTKVQLVAPDTLPAGGRLTIRIQSAAPLPISLLYTGGYGTRAIALPVITDTTITTREKSSGRLTVKVIAADSVVASATVFVQPGTPIDPVDAYVGPKALVAGEAATAWLTAVPQDSLGNMLTDGTPVAFSILAPTRHQQSIHKKLQHGIGFVPLQAGTVTGKTLAGIRVGHAASWEKELITVAGVPVAVRLLAARALPFADGRQTFRVYTAVLKDVYGNILPDGYHVLFYCFEADHTQRTINGYTIAGVATAIVQQPAAAGPLRIVAVVNGQRSNELSLSFLPVLKATDLRYDTSGVVIIGPLHGPQGQLLPDGTPVYLRTGERTYTSLLQQGRARFATGRLARGSYPTTVTVGVQTFTSQLSIP